MKLLDRKLGILYFMITTLVLAYVFGVRFFLDKGYNAVERSNGVVGIQLTGRGYTKTNGIVAPADIASLVQIGPEGDSLFLPTRWITWPDQRRGNCTSPDEPCSGPNAAAADADCARSPPLAAGKCEGSLCERYQWCEPGDDGKYMGPTAPKDPFAPGGEAAIARAGGETVLQELGAIDKPGLMVVLMAAIDFPRLSDAQLQTEESKSRVRWTMAQVLQRAGMTEEQATTMGGVLSVVLQWNCPNLWASGDCLPSLQVTQLAPEVPFYRQWANYYRRAADPAIEYRELHQARGLRLLVTSKGIGEQIDLEMIMLQIFVMLALMPIASILADTIMQNFFAERRHYREYKTELSPDFSDVRAKVEQLEKQSQSRHFKQMEYA